MIKHINIPCGRFPDNPEIEVYAAWNNFFEVDLVTFDPIEDKHGAVIYYYEQGDIEKRKYEFVFLQEGEKVPAGYKGRFLDSFYGPRRVTGDMPKWFVFIEEKKDE